MMPSCQRITHEMTTTEIHQILTQNRTTRSLYRGIYPCDLLPRYALSQSQKPALIVVNHAPSTTKGTHWSLLFFPKSVQSPAYYFDSFGRPIAHPSLADIKSFINHNSTKSGFSYNKIKLQDDRSSSCGQFAIAVAWLLARGVSPHNIDNYFVKKSLKLNDCTLRKMIKEITKSYLMLWLSLLWWKWKASTSSSSQSGRSSYYRRYPSLSGWSCDRMQWWWWWRWHHHH